MNRFRWQDGLITMVGLWLFISPVILGYGGKDAVALDAVAWNFILSGLAILTISVLTLFWYRSWEKCADIVIGVWLASSPWSMNFSDMLAARLNTWGSSSRRRHFGRFPMAKDPFTHCRTRPSAYREQQ